MPPEGLEERGRVWAYAYKVAPAAVARHPENGTWLGAEAFGMEVEAWLWVVSPLWLYSATARHYLPVELVTRMPRFKVTGRLTSADFPTEAEAYQALGHALEAFTREQANGKRRA